MTLLKIDAKPFPVQLSLIFLLLVEYAAGGALYTYLALFLKDKRLEPPQIALVLFCAAAASSLMPFLWGWVADRLLALNRLLPLMHLVSASLLAVLVNLQSYGVVLVCFTLYNGIRQPIFSLVNALCYHNLSNPAVQFGRLRLWGSLGWMVPILPVYLWHRWTGSDSMSFPIYLALALEVSLVVTSPLFPRTPPPGKRERVPQADESADPESRPSRYAEDLRKLFFAPGFGLLLAVTYLVMCSFSVMFYYSNLRLEEVRVPRAWIGPVLAFGVLFEIPLFLMLDRVLRRLGFRGTLALGAASSVARQLIFAVSASRSVVVAASVLIAPCVVYFLITSSLAANALAPRAVRATAQSLMTLVGTGLGTMSGLFATYLLTESLDSGMWLPFLFAATTSAAGLVFMRWMRFEERSPAASLR